MVNSIKALIVVLAIAATIFRMAKPIALQFMSEEDFARRRYVWFVLTAVSFASPNFWIYVIVAVPTAIWANRRDSNPVALYLSIFHVIPPVGIIIPLVGNNGLFPLDNYRLLALCVLLPATIQYRKSHRDGTAAQFGVMDVLLLAFGALVIVLYVPPDLPYHYVIPDSPSNILRRAVLFLLDTYLLYFAISRICQSRPKMVEAAATFCLACAVMSAIALFEHLRNWLLYTDVMTRWTNNPNAAFYLSRGGSVRAQTSAGHSIALGNLLAVGFGFWLYFKSYVHAGIRRNGVTFLLLAGLWATNSRGAWLGAAATYFTFLAVGPRAVSSLVKGTAAALVLAGLVVISPIGDKILDLLPKSGQPADLYRHQLAERGWQLVMAHPLFGDQFPWPEMEDLRQGEGIIDIVNSYLGVALNYGLIGLFLFVSFILLGTLRIYARNGELESSDPDLAVFGRSLIACIVGILIMIDSNSFTLGCQKIFYVLAALSAAYLGLTKSSRTRSSTLGARNTLPD